MRKKTPREYLVLLLIITAATTIISALYAARLGLRQVGSFEYVRKGEDLLDKSKFQESIIYFKKAHESSPGNDTITSELIDAYDRHSVYLAESKDYNKAIDCLAKAYDVRITPNTIQNLAIMYSKKAVWEASDDLVAAKEDFRSAREIAAVSVTASKNLGISLFNDAAMKFKSGEDGLALIFLKEASLSYKNNPTFKLLGDIYYKKTEFEKARMYFGKALAMDPYDRDAREKLQKVTKELRLAGQEESKSFEHFELRYDKKLQVDADSVKETLEKCYFDVGRDFKYFPSSKTVVFLYSQDDFKNIFKLPSGIRAFYDGNIRIPLPNRALNRDEFSKYIYHEYTHAVVSAMTNNNCPPWLSEGLAVWEEYKDKDDAMSHVFGKSVDRKQLSISSLYTAFNFETDGGGELRASYLLAYSIVKYIIDNWGMVGVRNLLAHIKDGRHFANAVDDEFLLSEKEFENRWRNYVIGKYLRKRTEPGDEYGI